MLRSLNRTVILTTLLATLLLVTNWQLTARSTNDLGESAPTEAMQALLADRSTSRPTEQVAMDATPCINGFAGIYPCENVDLLSFTPNSALGGGSANDIWGWTDPVSGIEYAIMGRTSGTSFVDISDPENPVYLGNLPTQTSDSTWRDIKVYADHAFIVSEAGGHGMQVFDLTRLRNVPSPPETFTNDAFYGEFGNAHNIVINEDSGYAYGVGTGTCSGGLHMVNIQDPLNPTNAGCFSSDGYTHDAECLIYDGPDTAYVGNEICFNSNEDTLTIVDVTDKSNPVQLSRTGYPGASYTHQGWTTEDHRYHLIDDETDESGQGHNTRTRIFDITDLDAPVLTGAWDGTTPAIDHNQYILGNNTYQSNYTAGLRILELTDLANGELEEVAYFDTYPSNDSTSFNGTWSNYPYYESGVVVVSGVDEGLFVVKPQLEPAFSAVASDTTLEVCEMGMPMSTLSFAPLNGYTGAINVGAFGLPSGTTASFSANPVTVPGSTTLTLDVTNATAPGIYTITAGGSDGTINAGAEIELGVYSGTAGAATLSGPADGATDINVVPTLVWQEEATATMYAVAIATDAGFTDIVAFEGALTDTSWTPPSPLDESTTYYWIVRTTNPCGGYNFSEIRSFTTRDVPSILLVDDDDNGPDVRAQYISALDAAGAEYDIWDTDNSDNEPSASELAPYQLVIWFTGDEFGGAAGPGADGEAALAAYLDSGDSCLWINSQDYYYDRGLTDFMAAYLGVASATSDVNQTSVTGVLPLFGNYTLSYPFTNYSDVVNPDATANLMYEGNQGNAAIYKLDGYGTSFWGFPFEALPEAGRNEMMPKIITWCDTFVTTGIDIFAAENN